MPVKRISDTMETALNDQMNREAFQSQVYLSYGSWAEVRGYAGVADFLYKHATEERNHMFKFLKYLNARGGTARLTAIEGPPADPTDLGDCLRSALEHEVENSHAIDRIVGLAHEERDWATFNFGQWFVQEQIEEETLIGDLLAKYDLAVAGGSHASLYQLDKDLGGASQEAEIPREESL